MIAALAGLAVLQSAAPRELGQIKFLVGDWVGSVSGASVAFNVANGPGGRSLRFSLRVSGSLIKPFSDEGHIWWDNDASAFRSHAMSSVSNDPRREIGRVSAGALVLVSEPFEVSGVSERTRRTLSKDGEGLRMKIDVRDGDSWKAGLSALLKRRK